MPRVKKNAFMWFEVAEDFPYKDGVIKKEAKVELFVHADGGKGGRGRQYAENIFLFIGSGDRYYIILNSFEDLKRFLILPGHCMISDVGDIFCAKTKKVFAVTHFGWSGFWGKPKRILPNQNHFKCCPECGRKLSPFSVFKERGIDLLCENGWIAAIEKEDE